MRCENCRFWSEMIAQSVGCDSIEALCLSEESPLYNKMIKENNGCQFGKENLFGSIDTPGVVNKNNER